MYDVCRRQDSKARSQLRSVFQRPSVQKALSLLENEVGKGKLAVRADRNCASDVGLRDLLLQVP